MFFCSGMRRGIAALHAVMDMIFRKEVYLTGDMNKYNRAKDVLADKERAERELYRAGVK